MAQQFSLTVPTVAAAPHMDGNIDDSWKGAVREPVLFDFAFAKPGEPTTVYVEQDPTGIDLAFEVTQSTQITATQQTNGAGVMNDDAVGVRLWPQGAGGFGYGFFANSLGARYQVSSENSSYSPEWTAVARRTTTGYAVTMHIPFKILRSGGSKTWRAQFERLTTATNSVQVWEHVQGQRNAEDPAYAGILNGMNAATQAAAMRPQPRLQIYALGELTTPGNGGSTSRIGGDFSVPVTQTSSVVGAFHPDYSNVEIDQQTISPSAFARRYSEVRPFFTQAGSFFNNTFNCSDCPTTLYTPAIPTFRDAYAYEGTAGPLSFSAFNVNGFSRDDNAEALNWTKNDSSVIEGASLQRVSMHVPGFDDTVTEFMSGFENQHTHFFVSYNGAMEEGTQVTSTGQGIYSDFGFGYVDKTSTYVVDDQKVGAQFNPVDGYTQQSDLHGYIAVLQKTFNLSKDGLLRDVMGQYLTARYHNSQGQTNSTLGLGQINLDFKDQISMHLFTVAQGVQIYDGEFLPFNQNGFYIAYKASTSTPTSVTYNDGAYFHGHLINWSYLTTLPLRRRLKLSLETDENAYLTTYAGESSEKQWLERASLDWQFSRFASFDLGARRIFGGNIPVAYAPVDFAQRYSLGNVTAAFHFLAAQNEFYVVYGDANSPVTTPALFVKWIRYIGAQKGT